MRLVTADVKLPEQICGKGHMYVQCLARRRVSGRGHVGNGSSFAHVAHAINLMTVVIHSILLRISAKLSAHVNEMLDSPKQLVAPTHGRSSPVWCLGRGMWCRQVNVGPLPRPPPWRALNWMSIVHVLNVSSWLTYTVQARVYLQSSSMDPEPPPVRLGRGSHLAKERHLTPSLAPQDLSRCGRDCMSMPRVGGQIAITTDEELRPGQ